MYMVLDPIYLQLMLTWLITFFQNQWVYLKSPILYHIATDGYVMTAIFTIMEMTDSYAAVILALLFTILLVLYRNTIFSTFKSSIDSVRFSHYSANQLNKTISQYSSDSKLLNGTHYRTVKSSFLGFVTQIRNFLK